MPQTLQYIHVKEAFDDVKSHPKLGLMVTDRWVTDGTLWLLVKSALEHSNCCLKNLTKTQFNRSMILHPAFKGQITRRQNCVGLYRLNVDTEFFYWIGDNAKFPRPKTPKWKAQVLEAEQLDFANHDYASVWKDEDETPIKRPRHDDASVAQSSTAQAAEMDEDGTSAKRLRCETSVPTMKPADIQNQTYWDSPEASIQFIPREEDASVLECTF
jgi:hypothetical protein